MASVVLTNALRDEYQRLFNTCVTRDRRIDNVETIVTGLSRNQDRYEAVGEPLGIPWYFIAAIHNMESSQRFDRHLHNGDPLSARTRQVPAGRPRSGTPPFTWEASAGDALTFKRLDRVTDWTLAGTLHRLEGYNGWGYRLYHPDVLSPYLWGFSTHYSGGKYVRDGRWSQTAVSAQCGAAVILRRMAERGLVALPQHDTPPSVKRDVARERPILRYSRSGELPYAFELQTFLNRLPGIQLRPDGWPGKRTSDAFLKATGDYLEGDPRSLE